jgi:hypothetical protein
MALSRELKPYLSQAWWCMLVILALGRLRQEDVKFKTSLGYVVASGDSKQSPVSLPVLVHKCCDSFVTGHFFILN